MRLAIVGSTCLEGTVPSGRIAGQIMLWQASIDDQREEFVVISGGARGVDTIAERAAELLGVPTIVHRPLLPSWDGPGGFMQRNLRIAEDCTHLLRVVCPGSKTYGSGWTRDRARELGKVILPELRITCIAHLERARHEPRARRER